MDIASRAKFLLKALIVTSLFVTGCTSEEESSSNGTSLTGLIPDQESWNSTIILSQSGVTSAVISANHLMKFERKGITQIDGDLKVDFYNRDGTHSSVLTADKATVDEKSEDLRAIGNVVVVSDDGSKLETDELIWDNSRRKIFANGQVTIKTQGGIEKGIGFESDPDLKRWTMREVVGSSEEEVEIPELK